jgi:hypothetical protein
MNQNYSVDFATFCHSGDVHRLHAPGQLKRQVKSNSYEFNKVIVVYQNLIPDNFHLPMDRPLLNKVYRYEVYDIDDTLRRFDIDLSRQQYVSRTDKAHAWKVHVANHLRAIQATRADYIVFADNDCWMVRQPDGKSWIDKGIKLLQSHPEIFIVSPNDGEPQRTTNRFSQQMFLARTKEFRNADFDQPNWDGDVNISGGPMPEYWGMLEGRMELHCRVTGQYRYVLGPEYRYWHFNRLTKDDLFETDLNKY